MPEKNTYRGERLFEEYFETSFKDIDNHLRTIGKDEEIIEIFDRLYKHIRFGEV